MYRFPCLSMCPTSPVLNQPSSSNVAFVASELFKYPFVTCAAWNGMDEIKRGSCLNFFSVRLHFRREISSRWGFIAYIHVGFIKKWTSRCKYQFCFREKRMYSAKRTANHNESTRCSDIELAHQLMKREHSGRSNSNRLRYAITARNLTSIYFLILYTYNYHTPNPKLSIETRCRTNRLCNILREIRTTIQEGKEEMKQFSPWHDHFDIISGRVH